MRNRRLISILLAAVAIALAILAYFILPETVVIQFSAGSSGNTTVPKLFAILIPASLGLGGAVATLFARGEEKSSGKGLLVSVIGIGLTITMIVVNSLMK